MKKITKNKYGVWQDTTEDDGTNFIEVPDDIAVGFLNSPYYHAKNFTQEKYTKAQERFDVATAKRLLLETDYVVLQWQDETELAIEHSRPRAEYRAILEQRQEARTVIRNTIDVVS